MNKAFVFGKFLPFHKGHEALIQFARKHCTSLTVLVCASDKEPISGALRKKWIENSIAGNTQIRVEVFSYREEVLPNTSSSSESVSNVWADAFKQVVPDCDRVISSEPYGDYVAAYMGIEHIPFDISRSGITISASEIRRDFMGNWDFLPNSVKEDLAIKVVILGTESTGKSTLTEKLARHYRCTYVSEAGRDLIPDSTQFALKDLELVAREHARRIQLATHGVNPLIMVDTDIHITQSYARFSFGKELEVPEELYQINKALLYLYLNNDVEYVQDGTRLQLTSRDELDRIHRTVLREYCVDWVEIQGSWKARFDASRGHIAKLLKKVQDNGILHVLDS